MTYVDLATVLSYVVKLRKQVHVVSLDLSLTL